MLMFRLFTVLVLCVQSLMAYELSIISMFRNEGPYLKEWVEYHRIAGVDHFYLYNNGSTDDGLDVLKPYIDEGLVELIDWPYFANEAKPTLGSYVRFQLEAFQNGLRRSIGKSKWVAMIDLDEFIVPKKGQTIVECLHDNFPNANAVFLSWRNFGTSFINVPKGEPLISKLIMCSNASHSDNSIGKSIVRPEAVDIDAIWYPHHFVLNHGFNYVNGSNQAMAKDGLDWKSDGRHHNKYMVIHHYCLRDEWFYQNVRLAKAQKGLGDYDLLVEHYQSFNLIPNYDAINFLKKFHKQEFDAYWGKY